MRDRIVFVRPYRHLQRGACLVVAPLSGVQHGQVVVGLRELRVFLRERRVGCNGFGLLPRVLLYQRLQKTHLWVARIAAEVLLGLGQGVRQLAVAHQLPDAGVIVGVCGGPGQSRNEQACANA